MSGSISENEYISNINKISNSISFIYLVIIIPFGFIANCVSIWIYLRPNLNKKSNTGFLYLCLSIMNIISLLNYAFIVRSRNLFGYTIDVTCGVDDYIRRNIFNATSWIQALISFDRFLFIFFPAKNKLFSQKKYLFMLMGCIMCFILITNSTNLISNSVISISFNNLTNQTVISESCVQTKIVSLATDFIAILMRLYIPFLIMVILNLLVIKKLYRTKKRVKKSTSNTILIQVTTSSKNLVSNGQRTFSNKEYKFVFATITMDLVFWIFYAPVSINLTLSIVNTFTRIFTQRVPAANYSLYSNLSQLMAFTYHSVAIFMYLAFNQHFRAEFLALFKLNSILPKWLSRPSSDVKPTRATNSVQFSLN
ncbi:unnamed protein product [Brachionus calyciflorus]|uniref:G-protein coupled receptors family 1 profile domain-containing protein n=1 Tax=Brachionus calyciflorus TaxID=104777 RepID=A0A813Y2D0_9BILA|nr:unnamed protein product [Brachionus calyciflorus]